MTSYVNPTTRSGGVEHVVVAERAPSIQVDEAPFDDTQYVRVNGEWQQATEAGLVPDTLAPSPPTALVANGTMAADGASVDYGLSWNAPTTNTDTTALTDLAYYVVRWRYGTTGAWATFVSNETSAILHALKPATDVQWQVLARDYSGNDSTWATDTITGLADDSGPEKPSLPSLVSRLGTVQATWDGLDSAGNPPAADFSHLEVYLSATTGGPWTYAGRMSGASTVFTSGFPLGATRFVTFVAFDTSGNASPRSNEASIVVQGITAPDLEANSVTANAIAVGAVAASKISTGELAAGVRIIAGPEASSHAEMTSSGFMAYVDDPIDGVPNLAVRMGSTDNDLFSIADGSGTTLASVDDRGHGNFRGVSVGQDAPVYEVDPDSGDIYLAEGLEVYGREFLDYLNERARGIAGFASATNQTWNGIGNTELPLYEMAFDGDPEREFWFHIDPLIFDPSAVARFALITRFTTDGSQPTIASPIMRFAVGSSPDGGAVSLGMDVTGVFSLYTRILVSAVCYTTGQTVNVLTGSNTVTRTAVYDMGRRLSDEDNTYIPRWSGANVGVPIKKTYMKEYLSSGSGTYRNTGFKRTDTTDVVQGYSSYNGDGEGLWTFPSMTADLAGSTVNKIQVYCYANHWYYNSGGTALIKVHNYSAPPASSPAMTTAISSAKWPKPGGRWVTLPSSTYAGFKAGTYKGFGLGPSGGTNLTYYGRFNGNGARIKVTYTK